MKSSPTSDRILLPGEGLGGMAISKAVWDYMVENIPIGKTILELGSGVGSRALLTRWKLYSVENKTDWLGKYHDNYIYAPRVNGWYDPEILKRELPKEYDFLLVDGPRGHSRDGIVKNFHLFRQDVPVLFDDTHRETVWGGASRICWDTKRTLVTYPIANDDRPKFFSVLECASTK